jgi:nitroreductase
LLARRTIRELSAADLTLQEISNILWAAKGVNRASSQFGLPGLTAASASNSQEVDVYVALRAGCYRFEPLESTLHLIVEGDHRRLALTPGQQLDVPLAPLQLIYVADVDKLVHTKGYQEPHLQDPEFQKAYYFVDTGLIAGNVYLYTASVGLGSWFHNCSQSLKDTLKLGKHQRVLFAQSVGHPG